MITPEGSRSETRNDGSSGDRRTVSRMQPRLRTAIALATLAGGGFAAAATLGATSTTGQTVTLRVTSPTTVVTLTVGTGSDAQTAVEAALDDPAKIPGVDDAQLRRKLTAELRELDAFLAPRPKLQPYRDHLWYVAHHSRWHLRARQVAAVLWCTVWFPRACDSG
jgi:hypothetical protein